MKLAKPQSRQFRLNRHPLAQQDLGPGAGPFGVRCPPRERHRARQQRSNDIMPTLLCN
jgi:hypothetical protein